MTSRGETRVVCITCSFHQPLNQCLRSRSFHKALRSNQEQQTNDERDRNANVAQGPPSRRDSLSLLANVHAQRPSEHRKPPVRCSVKFAARLIPRYSHDSLTA